MGDHNASGDNSCISLHGNLVIVADIVNHSFLLVPLALAEIDRNKLANVFRKYCVTT